MRIKLTKITELPDARHPNNIPVGKEYEGEMRFTPEIGNRFNLWEGDRNVISTSAVQEILSETEFKTLSSVYKMEQIS